MSDLPTDPADLHDDRPSKSQVKREMHALLDLGRALIALPASRLAELPLDEPLREAIALAQRIHSHEGRRRQEHYVGKRMRYVDADAIRTQLAIWAQGSQAETRALHRVETLRDQLLADDTALTDLIRRFPDLDIQPLRAQIRAARQEARSNAALTPDRTPARKHYRALFQTLKNLDFEDDEPDGSPA